MIKHIWSVTCRSSSIDYESNNISLEQILEQIQVYLPVGFVPNKRKTVGVGLEFQVVSYWMREDIEKGVRSRAKYQLISPSGKDILPPALMPIDLVEKPRFRTRLKVPAGLPVSEEGYYNIRVSLERPNQNDSWETIVDIPIQIEFISKNN